MYWEQIGSINSTSLLEEQCVSNCTDQSNKNFVVIGKNISSAIDILFNEENNNFASVSLNVTNKREMFPNFLDGFSYAAINNQSCGKNLYLWNIIEDIKPIATNSNNEIIMFGRNSISTPFFPKSLNESFLYSTNSQISNCNFSNYDGLVEILHTNAMVYNFEICINNELKNFTFQGAMINGKTTPTQYSEITKFFANNNFTNNFTSYNQISGTLASCGIPYFDLSMFQPIGYTKIGTEIITNDNSSIIQADNSGILNFFD